MEKYCRAVQATDDNVAHAHCVLGTEFTEAEYVILTVMPRHVWLCQRATVLHYTRIVCDVQFCTFRYILRFEACGDDCRLPS
jgi:hypothetical protein